ncbi:hypothetical protein H6G89_30000 [Oscillatoria sp. FACHB-1407]|uniref:hypothetical protein n=1 Tax=Oscillatoria sp. FACHB-1407 TaxID=2692847 RepID=UPI001684F31B|nr:hypothetical protein [Oscillatoria sp. FACHB-1407]MBD2465247.1 hypothetical protein [Oscillatoria sp. FACHB-1407]
MNRIWISQTQKWFIPIATGTGLMLSLLLAVSPNADSQQTHSPAEVDSDNIYHEDDNLPDDADVFPRMGRLLGSSSDRNNCRIRPWGQVVNTIPGGAFVEIDHRRVDQNNESWFHAPNQNCWVHDSRIDLL